MASRYANEVRLTLPDNFHRGKIGVVTILYNSAAVLPDFFQSIEHQNYTNFIVYCVDNASSDGSVEMCQKRQGPYITIANKENLGVAAGNNQGIRAAVQDGCEYVLLLNNDVVFGPQMFEELLEGLHKHDADMATPKIFYHDRPSVIWCAGGGFNALAGFRQIHRGDGEQDGAKFSSDLRVEYSPTCCVLMKRDLFQTVGVMDERYFVYWDDTDWMLRAKRAGAKLWFLHGPQLWHKVSSLTGGTSEFTLYYSTRNHAYYFYKHLPVVLAAIYSRIYRIVYRISLFSPRTREDARVRLSAWHAGMKLFSDRHGD